MKFSSGAVALVMMAALFCSIVIAEPTITFEFSPILYSGDRTTFRFKSTEILLREDRIKLAWDDKTANAGRSTNCLFFSSLTQDPGYYDEAFNFANGGCFLETDDVTPHITSGTTATNVASLALKNAASSGSCNNNIEPFIDLTFVNTDMVPETGIPAETWITCDVFIAPQRMVLNDVTIVRLTEEEDDSDQGIAFTFSMVGEETDPRMYVTPTKAYIDDVTTYDNDPWSFSLDVHAERPGIVNLAMVPSIFAFDGTGYSADNVWCSGGVARMVPISGSLFWMDSSININFFKQNTTTTCLFRIRPSQPNVIFPSTSSVGGSVNARLHQQPLQTIFNTTQLHFKENYLSTYTGAANIDTSDKLVDKVQPTVQLSFPIPPEIIQDTVFFAKFTSLDGTTVTPQEFLATTTITNGGGQDTTVALDIEDPSRIKITYNVDYISPGWQQLGLNIVQNTPLLAASRLRFQVSFTDSQGSILIGTESIAAEWVSPLQITYAEQTYPTSSSTKFVVRFLPFWANSTPGSLLRITSKANVSKSASCTIGGSSVTVVNKRGVIFAATAQVYDLGVEIEAICTVTAEFPYLWNANLLQNDISFIPALIAGPQYASSSILVTGNSYSSFPGYVTITEDDPIWPEPVEEPEDPEDPEDPEAMISLNDDEEAPAEAPAGWITGSYSLTFRSGVDYNPSPTVMISDLQTRVERVLNTVIKDFSIEGGFPLLQNSTFAGLYYPNSWANYPSPITPIPGTFDWASSVHDVYQSKWLISWSISCSHLNSEEFNAYRSGIADLIKIAIDGVPATETTEAILPTLEPYDLVNNSGAIQSSNSLEAWFSNFEECKGVASWGYPGCIRKLPGQVCVQSQECSRFRCLSTGVCAEHQSPGRPYNTIWSGAEGSSGFSAESFDYLSSSSALTTVFAFSLVIIASLMF